VRLSFTNHDETRVPLPSQEVVSACAARDRRRL